MALIAVLIFILTAVALSPVTDQQQDSCAACNCPLETDMDLDGYVNSRINAILGNEPRKLNVIIKISSLQKVREIDCGMEGERESLRESEYSIVEKERIPLLLSL